MRWSSLVRLSWSADLLLTLTQKEIKVRYTSSWLGYLWSVANPLAFALVYFTAFGVFMRMEVPGYPYPVFLIAGIFPWQWFANSVNAAPMTFISNSSLIKKVRFPRNALVASIVLNDCLHYLVSLPVIMAALLVYDFQPAWSWVVGVPLFTIAQFLLVYGIALAVASISVFFRDLERLTAIATTFLFFLTPIVYPAAAVPPRYDVVLSLNPVAPVIRGWQDLLLAGTFDLDVVVAAYGYGIFFLLLGSLVYQLLAPRFAELV